MAGAMFDAPQFTDDIAAREHLESIRWPNGPVCPRCGGCNRNSKLNGASHRAGQDFCGDCREPFTVTVGTVFESSKVPLRKWVLATHLMSSSKKSIRSHQLGRMLCVTYKTDWIMSHRIREAMAGGIEDPLGSNGEAVEVDETNWGNVSKQRKGARAYAHKMKTDSLVERDGEKRAVHGANVTAKTLRPILDAKVSKKSRVLTDEAVVYAQIGRNSASHDVVNHSQNEYARGEVMTNTVESSFASLKRGLYGTIHHVSETRLQGYADEFDFRWNQGAALAYSDTERADAALKGIAGKRLAYRHTLRFPSV